MTKKKKSLKNPPTLPPKKQRNPQTRHQNPKKRKEKKPQPPVKCYFIQHFILFLFDLLKVIAPYSVPEEIDLSMLSSSRTLTIS